jgi:transcriptional regulator with XRE-family HTH domain
VVTVIDPDRIQTGQDLAEQLRALYVAGGWSMHRMADAAGLSSATVRNMINGPSVPQASTLEAFVAACGQRKEPWLRARGRALRDRESGRPSPVELQEQVEEANARARRAEAALYLTGASPDQVLKSQAQAKLEQFVTEDPITDPKNGHLYLVAHPAAGREDALADLFTRRPEHELDPIVGGIVRDRGRSDFSPDLTVGFWERRGIGYTRANGTNPETGVIREDRFLETAVHEDGAVTLVCGLGTLAVVPGWQRVGSYEEPPTLRAVSPSLVLGLTYGALALAGTLADVHTGYQHIWLIGLRLTGLRGAWAYEHVREGDHDTVRPYDRDVYERTAVCETSDLLHPAALTEKLAGALIRGLSSDHYMLPYPQGPTQQRP